MKLPGIKRILPLILTVLFLPVLLAVPARAEDIGPWLNLMDYSSVNNSGGNYIKLSASGAVAYYEMPYSSMVYAVDVVVYSEHPLTGVQISRNNADNTYVDATVTDLGGDYYRIYLKRNTVFYGVYMKFFYEGTSTNILQFNTVRVATADMINMYIPMNAILYDYSVTPENKYDVIKKADNSTSNQATWFPPNDSINTRFLASCPIPTSEWSKYDYIHFSATVQAQDITSVTVTHGGYNVPFTYHITDNSIGFNVYYVDIIVDLRDFDRTSTSRVVISINGSSSRQTDSLNRFSIASCIGVVDGSNLDPTVYWFTSLQAWLSDHTNSLKNVLMVGLPIQIESFITEQTAAFSDMLTSVSNTINFEIGKVNATIKSVLGQVTLIPDLIGRWGQNIVNAINPPADTDDMRNEVENIRDQMQDANDVMNELQRPDIDDVFYEVQLDIGTGSPFADIMSGLFANDFIVTIVTGSLAFTLFGILVG